MDLNDPSLETDEFWQRYYARLSEQQRPLENNSWVDVTAQAGDRAALSCRVRHLGTRPVSGASCGSLREAISGYCGIHQVILGQ